MATYDGILKFVTSLDTSGVTKGLKSVGSVASTAMKGIATGVGAVGGLFTSAIAGATALVESTSELNNDLAKFNTNVQTNTRDQEKMNEQLSRFTAITGEADSAIEGLSNLMKTPLDDNQLQTALDNFAGAVVAFPDTLKFESLSDSLQETLATGKGVGQFAELLERSGVNIDEFNEDLANASNEAERNAIAMQYLAETGLAEVGASYEEANKDQLSYEETQFEIQKTLGEFAKVLLPIVNQALEFFNNHLKQLVEPVGTLLTAFVGMVTGVEGSSETFKEVVSELLTSLVKSFIGIIPTLASIAVDIIFALIGVFQEPGMINNLLTSFKDLLLFLIPALNDILPELALMALDIILALVDVFLAPETIDEMMNGFTDFLDKFIAEVLPKLPSIMATVAKGIVEGLWTGIKNLGSWFGDKIGGWISDNFSYSSSGSDSMNDRPIAWEQYQSSVEAAEKRGEDSDFTYDEWVEAGSSAPSWATSPSNPANQKSNEPTIININQPVSTPDETAKAIDNTLKYGMAGGGVQHIW